MTADGPTIDLQLTCDAPGLPDRAGLSKWLAFASEAIGRDDRLEMSIRVVDADESRALNREFRGKDRPTNVLSFPSDLASLPGLPAEDSAYLGDIVLCAPVVAEEARAQGKAAEAHWLHLVLHGYLHLNGYDHQTEAQASEMEALESRLMLEQGLPDPYKHAVSN